MGSPNRPEDVARRELGEFFRSRRQRLTPADVGLADTERRRTPGLRREEVAALAHVSHSWYTWVEQGRSMNASPELLLSVCHALRLGDAEISYVLDLIARHADQTETPAESCPRSDLLGLLEGLPLTPALLYDYCWDILASNQAWKIAFGNIEQLPRRDRNIVRLAFKDDPSVEVRRPEIVSWFRAEFARHPNDARIRSLVDDLRATSPEFERLWNARDVGVHGSGFRMTATRWGPTPMSAFHLQGLGVPELRVLMVTPDPESDFTARLAAARETWVETGEIFCSASLAK